MLEHGGKLREAMRHYGGSDWIDLSTGIDIGRAWRLVTHTTALWLGAGLVLTLLPALLEALHA